MSTGSSQFQDLSTRLSELGVTEDGIAKELEDLRSNVSGKLSDEELQTLDTQIDAIKAAAEAVDTPPSPDPAPPAA